LTGPLSPRFAILIRWQTTDPVTGLRTTIEVTATVMK
jgi:hypothetical protein